MMVKKLSLFVGLFLLLFIILASSALDKSDSDEDEGTKLTQDNSSGENGENKHNNGATPFQRNNQNNNGIEATFGSKNSKKTYNKDGILSRRSRLSIPSKICCTFLNWKGIVCFGCIFILPFIGFIIYHWISQNKQPGVVLEPQKWFQASESKQAIVSKLQMPRKLHELGPAISALFPFRQFRCETKVRINKVMQLIFFSSKRYLMNNSVIDEQLHGRIMTSIIQISDFDADSIHFKIENLTSLNSEEAFSTFGEDGKSLAFYCGHKGHAMLCEVCKIRKDDSFVWRLFVYNSGEGLKYHASYTADGMPFLYSPVLILEGEPSAIHKDLIYNMTNSVFDSSDDFYRALFPSFVPLHTSYTCFITRKANSLSAYSSYHAYLESRLGQEVYRKVHVCASSFVLQEFMEAGGLDLYFPNNLTDFSLTVRSDDSPFNYMTLYVEPSHKDIRFLDKIITYNFLRLNSDAIEFLYKYLFMLGKGAFESDSVYFKDLERSFSLHFQKLKLKNSFSPSLKHIDSSFNETFAISSSVSFANISSSGSCRHGTLECRLPSLDTLKHANFTEVKSLVLDFLSIEYLHQPCFNGTETALVGYLHALTDKLLFLHTYLHEQNSSECRKFINKYLLFISRFFQTSSIFAKRHIRQIFEKFNYLSYSSKSLRSEIETFFGPVRNDMKKIINIPYYSPKDAQHISTHTLNPNFSQDVPDRPLMDVYQSNSTTKFIELIDQGYLFGSQMLLLSFLQEHEEYLLTQEIRYYIYLLFVYNKNVIAPFGGLFLANSLRFFQTKMLQKTKTFDAKRTDDIDYKLLANYRIIVTRLEFIRKALSSYKSFKDITDRFFNKDFEPVNAFLTLHRYICYENHSFVRKSHALYRIIITNMEMISSFFYDEEILFVLSSYYGLMDISFLTPEDNSFFQHFIYGNYTAVNADQSLHSSNVQPSKGLEEERNHNAADTFYQQTESPSTHEVFKYDRLEYLIYEDDLYLLDGERNIVGKYMNLTLKASRTYSTMVGYGGELYFFRTSAVEENFTLYDANEQEYGAIVLGSQFLLKNVSQFAGRVFLNHSQAYTFLFMQYTPTSSTSQPLLEYFESRGVLFNFALDSNVMHLHNSEISFYFFERYANALNEFYVVYTNGTHYLVLDEKEIYEIEPPVSLDNFFALNNLPFLFVSRGSTKHMIIPVLRSFEDFSFTYLRLQYSTDDVFRFVTPLTRYERLVLVYWLISYKYYVQAFEYLSTMSPYNVLLSSDEKQIITNILHLTENDDDIELVIIGGLIEDLMVKTDRLFRNMSNVPSYYLPPTYNKVFQLIGMPDIIPKSYHRYISMIIPDINNVSHLYAFSSLLNDTNEVPLMSTNPGDYQALFRRSAKNSSFDVILPASISNLPAEYDNFLSLTKTRSEAPSDLFRSSNNITIKSPQSIKEDMLLLLKKDHRLLFSDALNIWEDLRHLPRTLLSANYQELLQYFEYDKADAAELMDHLWSLFFASYYCKNPRLQEHNTICSSSSCEINVEKKMLSLIEFCISHPLSQEQQERLSSVIGNLIDGRSYILQLAAEDKAIYFALAAILVSTCILRKLPILILPSSILEQSLLQLEHGLSECFGKRIFLFQIQHFNVEQNLKLLYYQLITAHINGDVVVFSVDAIKRLMDIRNELLYEEKSQSPLTWIFRILYFIRHSALSIMGDADELMDIDINDKHTNIIGKRELHFSTYLADTFDMQSQNHTSLMEFLVSCNQVFGYSEMLFDTSPFTAISPNITFDLAQHEHSLIKIHKSFTCAPSNCSNSDYPEVHHFYYEHGQASSSDITTNNNLTSALFKFVSDGNTACLFDVGGVLSGYSRAYIGKMLLLLEKYKCVLYYDDNTNLLIYRTATKNGTAPLENQFNFIEDTFGISNSQIILYLDQGHCLGPIVNLNNPSAHCVVTISAYVTAKALYKALLRAENLLSGIPQENRPADVPRNWIRFFVSSINNFNPSELNGAQKTSLHVSMGLFDQHIKSKLLNETFSWHLRQTYEDERKKHVFQWLFLPSYASNCLWTHSASSPETTHPTWKKIFLLKPEEKNKLKSILYPNFALMYNCSLESFKSQLETALHSIGVNGCKFLGHYGHRLLSSYYTIKPATARQIKSTPDLCSAAINIDTLGLYDQNKTFTPSSYTLDGLDVLFSKYFATAPYGCINLNDTSSNPPFLIQGYQGKKYFVTMYDSSCIYRSSKPCFAPYLLSSFDFERYFDFEEMLPYLVYSGSISGLMDLFVRNTVLKDIAVSFIVARPDLLDQWKFFAKRWNNTRSINLLESISQINDAVVTVDSSVSLKMKILDGSPFLKLLSKNPAVPLSLDMSRLKAILPAPDPATPKDGSKFYFNRQLIIGPVVNTTTTATQPPQTSVAI